VHGGNRDHPLVIESMLVYGQSLNGSGQFEKSAVVYRDALSRTAAVFGEQSKVYGEALSAMVPLEIDIGALRSAIAHGRQAIRIYLLEGEPGANPHVSRARKLGSALLAARAGDEAVAQLTEALRLAIAAKASLESVHARGSLGLALAYQGNFAAADRELRQAIGTPGEVPTRGQHLAMRNLGISLRLQGQHAAALPWLERATAAASIQPSHRGDLAQGLLEMGLIKLDLGEIDAADKLFERSRVLFEDVQQGNMTPAHAELLVAIARADSLRGNLVAAEARLQAANAFWRDFDPRNRWAGEPALWLGRCQLALGHKAEARETLGRAAALLSGSPLPGDAALLKLARRR
jgi:tetratricopeptide (TPR) repeat protein